MQNDEQVQTTNWNTVLAVGTFLFLHHPADHHPVHSELNRIKL